VGFTFGSVRGASADASVVVVVYTEKPAMVNVGVSTACTVDAWLTAQGAG
jgi:hypothetical protein